MSELFYIQDTRSWLGNSPVWWGHNRCGYTSKLLDAGVYSEEEAARQHRCRNSDVPWPKDYVDARQHVTVDIQSMSLDEALKDTGIKLVKPKKVRQTTGQTRGNCPCCGKITWNHNPYEHAYCNYFCESTHEV